MFGFKFASNDNNGILLLDNLNSVEDTYQISTALDDTQLTITNQQINFTSNGMTHFAMHHDVNCSDQLLMLMTIEHDLETIDTVTFDTTHLSKDESLVHMKTVIDQHPCALEHTAGDMNSQWHIIPHETSVI